MTIKGLMLLAAALVATAPAANAAVVITIAQTGSDVTATASGSLNLTGLTRGSTVLNAVGIASGPGYVGFGGDVVMASYTGFTGGGGFGTAAAFTPASTSPGTDFAFSATGAAGRPLLLLPLQFPSGATIESENVFAGSSLASLGLMAGSYVFRSSGDTITINVADAGTAVPEPATWGLMLAGCALIGAGLRSRRRSVTYA